MNHTTKTGLEIVVQLGGRQGKTELFLIYTFIYSFFKLFRSPDLTPLDFFLWGSIKNEVYYVPPATRDELENKVRAAIHRITPRQLREVVRATIEKVQLCQQQDGGHFEHLEP